MKAAIILAIALVAIIAGMLLLLFKVILNVLKPE